MARLTEHGAATVEALSRQYGLDAEAVESMLHAVVQGGGTMAQFSHPAFSGSGQWMRGGMTMTSDMFNHQLNGLVNGLCAALSDALALAPLLTPERGDPGFAWWPEALGAPSVTGGQNDDRYALFPLARRLAVLRGDTVTVHDTGEHQIGGVSQQQDGMGTRLTFSSQFGQFDVSSLPRVEDSAAQTEAPPPPPAEDDRPLVLPDIPFDPGGFGEMPPLPPRPAAPPAVQADPLDTLERLAALMERGFVTREEFDAKKADLLARI